MTLGEGEGPRCKGERACWQARRREHDKHWRNVLLKLADVVIATPHTLTVIELRPLRGAEGRAPAPAASRADNRCDVRTANPKHGQHEHRKRHTMCDRRRVRDSVSTYEDMYFLETHRFWTRT
jgi:hypothetical protein